VTSGFSSTVIIVTLGSILGGSGIWIWYLLRSTLQQDDGTVRRLPGGGFERLVVLQWRMKHS